jgi:hypothetical protein
LYNKYIKYKCIEKKHGHYVVILKSGSGRPFGYERKFGKLIKINYYMEEYEKLIEIVEGLSKSNLVLFEVKSRLDELFEVSVKIPANEMWKIFVFLSQNKCNHYVDVFSSIFSLFVINWEDESYFSYILFRNRFF